VICADQIYRIRSNRAFCQRQRNAVEGKIGQGKRRFGLGLIRE
jgi:hypothetical protein